MDSTEILPKIIEIVRDELDDDSIALTRETKARDVEGWDSLAHVRIVIAVETAFSARFGTAEITSLSDVGELVDLVERHTDGN